MATPVNHPLADQLQTCYTASVGATPVPAAFVAPYRLAILKAGATLSAAISSTDSIVTLAISSVAVTNGTITITQSGSAANSTFSCTPTAANIANEGDVVSFTATAGGGSAIGCNFYAVTRKIA